MPQITQWCNSLFLVAYPLRTISYFHIFVVLFSQPSTAKEARDRDKRVVSSQSQLGYTCVGGHLSFCASWRCVFGHCVQRLSYLFLMYPVLSFGDILLYIFFWSQWMFSCSTFLSTCCSRDQLCIYALIILLGLLLLFYNLNVIVDAMCAPRVSLCIQWVCASAEQASAGIQA